MKVARWKVLGLAGALVLGYVATSDAAQIKVSDDTWANFGLNMKIWYNNLDKRSNSTSSGGWSQNVFNVGQTKVYFTGQVTKLFQFYAELDNNRATDYTEGSTTVGEAGINLAFAKEFQALIGKIRKPFTKAQINSGYALLTPQGYWLDPQDLIKSIKGQLGSTDRGLVFHGDLAGGILNYRIGVFNEDRTNGTKMWGGVLAENDTAYRNTGWISPGYSGKLNDKKNFEWAARVEFQPLMLGFKPDSAATITAKSADTWLGSKDVFIIGLGYNKEKHTPKLSSFTYATVNATGAATTASGSISDKTLDRTGWTIDATFEKKFGNLVPNLQAGYIKLDDSHFYTRFSLDEDNNLVATPKKGDTNIWYIQGQLLYDQIVGLGKPALAFRYERMKADGESAYYYRSFEDEEIVEFAKKKDLKVSTFGLALNYYIKGQAARISLGFDTTKYDGAAKYWLKYGNPATKSEDRITDWYLYFQSQF